MENGATSAMKHFSSKQSLSINESTARKLNSYLEKLKEVSKCKSGNKNLPCAYTGTVEPQLSKP